MAPLLCDCGSGKAYDLCCGPYLKGNILPPVTLGRNEACFCGPGKKYKKSHTRQG
jgi:uncharacterized protein YchJ